MEVHAIKVTLLGTKPPIWRRFLVEREIPVSRLHTLLQRLMGWTNSHLHQFVVQGRKLPERWTLGEALGLPGEKIGCTTLAMAGNMSRGWRRCWSATEAFQPVCVAGARNCPPEDCGGIYGYAELLESIARSGQFRA